MEGVGPNMLVEEKNFERWQYIGTQKNGISEPRVKENNEDGWRNYKEMPLP